MSIENNANTVKCLALQLFVFSTMTLVAPDIRYVLGIQKFICALRLFSVKSDPCSILSTAVLSSHRFIPLLDTTADDVID